MAKIKNDTSEKAAMPVAKKVGTAQAKAKTTKPKVSRQKSEKQTRNSMTAHKKMQLLFTIINKEKTEFFVDLLYDFEVNLQMVLSAQGTASDHIISLLGLTNSNKSVIISAIRQDKARAALNLLDEKFKTVRDGKGIAYTVPISSTIGVAIYQFLSNTAGGGII